MSSRVRHDDFLRRLSTGDLVPGSDEARRHFGECQNCRERWLEMARLIEELEGADLERREVLTQTGDPTPRDVERSLRAAVTAGVATPPAPRDGTPERRSVSGPRRTAILWLAAAAMVCAAFFVVRAWTSYRSQPDLQMMLGSGDRRILDVDGVLDKDGVTIDYALGAMCGFHIELEGWSNGVNVTERVTIWAPQWRPEPALLSRFDGPVVVRVQPFTAGGQLDGPPFERKFLLSR